MTFNLKLMEEREEEHRKIIMNMLDYGTEVEVIAASTGIPLAEVQAVEASRSMVSTSIGTVVS